MPNMKYVSELYIITHQKVDKSGNPFGTEERVNIPVHSFEVEGGANRKINLNSTDEITVSSEFEQARSNSNFVFYIPPTKDFLAVKIMDLQKNSIQFDLDFVVSVYSKGKITQTLRFSSDSAWFFQTPVPEGGTPPLLKTKVRFSGSQLLHGKLDPKRKKIVHREI